MTHLAVCSARANTVRNASALFQERVVAVQRRKLHQFGGAAEPLLQSAHVSDRHELIFDDRHQRDRHTDLRALPPDADRSTPTGTRTLRECKSRHTHRRAPADTTRPETGSDRRCAPPAHEARSNSSGLRYVAMASARARRSPSGPSPFAVHSARSHAARCATPWTSDVGGPQR